MRAPVKTIIALALLVVLGFATAGCGSGRKSSVSPPITVTGRSTLFSGLKTGTLVRCKGGPRATVPPLGGSAAAGEDQLIPVGTTPPPSSAPSREIQVTHRQNGVVKVSCKPSS
jgi:hypothetical protein